MPKYNFQCDKCEYVTSEVMTISEYLKKKEETSECPDCEAGVLFQVLNPVRSKIERRKEELIPQIEEEARKLVEKVKSGDEKAIADVYGDRLNPHKKKKKQEKTELTNGKRHGSFSRVG